MWDIQPLCPNHQHQLPSPNKASILGQSLSKAELSLRHSPAKLLSNATVQGSEISFGVSFGVTSECSCCCETLRLLTKSGPDKCELKVKATFEFSFKSILLQKLRKPLATSISFPQSLYVHSFNSCHQNSFSAVNFSMLGHGIVSSVCLLWNLIL